MLIPETPNGNHQRSQQKKKRNIHFGRCGREGGDNCLVWINENQTTAQDLFRAISVLRN